MECMEEHQVTLDGETLGLNEPFFVIATQNPIENAGTFPLPEAQLDRFFMKLSMGSMSAEDELAMLERFEAGRPLDEITPIMDAASVLEMKAQAEISSVATEPLRDIVMSVFRRKRHSL